MPEIDITYTTYGTFDPGRNNVVWVCHALTANADAAEWWPGLVGPGKFFDPEKYFIVCANMLGSCYGATCADSIHPETGKPYGRDFPLITIRDMIRSHEILREHLGIEKIFLCLGGSMGGQQSVEWSIMNPDLIEYLCLIACNAQHSPWGIAFNEAQRMALLADASLYSGTPDAGKAGLEAARAIGMISYRHYNTFGQTQQDEHNNKLENFRAATYQRYQGLKLSRRFSPRAYITLSKAMDSHNVGRNRPSVEAALGTIRSKTLVVGIQSDVLFPVEEQIRLAHHIPGAHLEVIDSMYGHDGFLLENDLLAQAITSLLEEKHPDGKVRVSKKKVKK